MYAQAKVCRQTPVNRLKHESKLCWAELIPPWLVSLYPPLSYRWLAFSSVTSGVTLVLRHSSGESWCGRASLWLIKAFQGNRLFTKGRIQLHALNISSGTPWTPSVATPAGGAEFCIRNVPKQSIRPWLYDTTWQQMLEVQKLLLTLTLTVWMQTEINWTETERKQNSCFEQLPLWSEKDTIMKTSLTLETATLILPAS